jgi:hypothetical protein
MIINTDTLVDAKGLLAALFTEDCRPTVRWLRTQTKNRNIPFIKLGGLVFFNVEAVRDTLEKKKTIRARRAP